MTDQSLRDALLKQNGSGSIEVQLNSLNSLVLAEERRARRLMFWTVLVWAVWVLMLMAAFGVPILDKATSRPGPAPVEQPATQPAAPSATAPARLADHTSTGVFKAFLGLLLLATFLCLPAIGIVLLIMAILARRSASLSQIRASLASIDTQLRLLAMTTKPPAARTSE